jgi:hypothetical protein
VGVVSELSESLVVTCGNAWWPGAGQAIGLPACPGRDSLEEPLSSLDGRRLVVCGTDADLAAVLLRLLRTDTLGDVPVGYVPSSVTSAVAQLWGLPVDPVRAASIALHGAAKPVPLVRDDTGGVLVGGGMVRPVSGVAYCDDDLVLRGSAPWLKVQPDPQHGLVVQVGGRSGWRIGLPGSFGPRVGLPGSSGRRTRLAAGRAVQLGCEPTAVWRDGVESRTPDRWTWFRHTEDWHLATP